MNSCSNPAPVGSQVQVVLNGAGPQAPTVVDQNNNIVSAVTAAPGLPGIWLVTLQAVQVGDPLVPAVSFPLFTWFNLLVNGVSAREQNVVVWLEG